jgi:hypothetical protein
MICYEIFAIYFTLWSWFYLFNPYVVWCNLENYYSFAQFIKVLIKFYSFKLKILDFIQVYLYGVILNITL